MKNDIINYIVDRTSCGDIKRDVAVKLLAHLKDEFAAKHDIAIVGISCRFSSSNSIDEYWNNLVGAKDLIRGLPANRLTDCMNYVSMSKNSQVQFKKQSYLDSIDQFDPAFFGMSPSDAATMDPHQRLLLQIAYEAMEDAGYGGGGLSGSRTGVFIGFSDDFRIPYYKYLAGIGLAEEEQNFPGNLSSIVAGRISYFLNLKGPALVIDTACSSALVAMYTACQSLERGNCDYAIAGGVKIDIIPTESKLKLGIESSTGRTKSFDESSDGTGFGEGVGAVLLKPLSSAIRDKDDIYAIVKGGSTNQDGRTGGITVPNVDAQTQLLIDAWIDASVAPTDISYIEAHGTGTGIGDLIEIEAIRKAFAKYTNRKQFCGIGTAKTNLGHLLESSGIAGIIKLSLCLKKGIIAPSIGFNVPGNRLNLIDSPVYIVDQQIDTLPEEKPLTVGISSFGFSGTNCHLVLQQFRGESDLNHRHSPAPSYVFVFSAKSLNSFKKLIAKWVEYLRDNGSDDMDLQKVALTLAAGRGHYEYRLAIAADSYAALYQRITEAHACLNTGIVSQKSENMCIGCHHRVKEEKRTLSDEDVTIAELKTISEKIRTRIEQSHQDQRASKSINAEILDAYVRGAEIDWGLVFDNAKGRISGLPVYQFDTKRCWLQPDLANQSAEDHADAIHPLIEKLKSKSINEDIYSTRFNPHKHWVLSDHIVEGKPVIPGYAYPEVAFQLGRIYFKDTFLELRNFSFRTPVIIRNEEEPVDVDIVVKHGEARDGLLFTVASNHAVDYNGTAAWTVHVEGEIHASEQKSTVQLDVEQLYNQCKLSEIAVDQNKLTEGFIQFGQRWISFDSLRMGEGCALAELALSKEVREDLSTYIAHPGLLDAAANILTIYLGNNKQIRYLPFSFEKMTFYSPIPERFISFSSLSKVDPTNETICCDVKLCDFEGNLILEICNYTMKRVNDFWRLVRGNMYSSLEWIAVSKDSLGRNRPGERILLLHTDDSLAKDLAAELSRRMISFQSVRLDDHHDTKCGIEEEGDKCCSVVRQIEEDTITSVLYLCPVDYSHQKEDELSEQTLVSIFMLLKGISNGISHKLHLTVITQNSMEITAEQKTVNPCFSGISGLLSVIQKENKNISTSFIDIDERTGSSDICDVFLSNEVGNIGLRGGDRYKEQWDILRISNNRINSDFLCEESTYVITGGTRGIGLEIAKALCSSRKIRVALISLNPEKSTQLKTAVEFMKNNGSTVHVYKCDVTAGIQVQETLSLIRKELGPIKGILHCAGVPGKGEISSKNVENFRNTIGPKVRGTYILGELTKNDKLDWFVVFSSVATILRLPGQSDYTAANMFLNSYASAQRRMGRNFVSINWTAWKATGMASDNKVDIDTLFKPLSIREGIESLFWILRTELKTAIVGEIVDNEVFRKILDVNISARINHLLRRTKTQETRLKNIELKGNADGKYSATEKRIANIWGSVLGYESIDIDADFFELGGDSILAAKVTNSLLRINENIDVAKIFQFTTVRKLAAFIDESGTVDAGQKQLDLQIVPKEVYEVSSAQRRIFIQEQQENIVTTYNVPVKLKLIGSIDAKMLQSAFLKAIERHEILRTTFEIADGRIVQRIHAGSPFSLDVKKCTTESEFEMELRCQIRPFDLAKGPLMRAVLFTLPEDVNYLLIDMHHIISDGYSIEVLLKDLTNFYNGDLVPELRSQYRNYSEREIDRLDVGYYVKQKQFWLNTLTDSALLNLPIDFPRKNMRSFVGGNYSFRLNRNLSEGIDRFARENSTTPSTVFLTLYSVFLHKICNQSDIVVGSMVAGRNSPETLEQIGVYINYLPVRFQVDNQKSLKDHLEYCNKEMRLSLENQEYPYDKMVEEIPVQIDTSRNPFFDTMLLFHNQVSSDGTRTFGECVLEEFELVNENNAKLDIRIEVRKNRSDEYVLSVEYNRDLFKDTTIRRFMKILGIIFHESINNSEKTIRNISIVDDTDRNLILRQFNGNGFEFHNETTLHEVFERRAALVPEQVGIVFRNHSMTYSEVNRRAEAIRCLLISKKIRKEEPVVMIMERSFEMMISILGILKAGCCFVPVDPKLPEERKKFILQDCGANIILTQTKFENEVGSLAMYVVTVDNLKEIDINACEPTIVLPNDLAYILYTSGSTGKPKGAMLEHRGIVNRLNWMQHKFPLAADDIELQKTTYTFDVSVTEFFWWIFAGAKLCFLEPEAEKDPEAITEAIYMNRISAVHFVPSMLNAFLQYVKQSKAQKRLSTIKYVICSGEELKPEVVVLFNQLLQKENGTKLQNLYGPTEASIDVTSFDCSSFEEGRLFIPIGWPVDNMRLYILDENRQLLPIGVPGEIYIAGIGVARGYLNQTKLTDEKFSEDPFYPGERMYRTGDLGCWLDDGSIRYLSRVDWQVKIRGQRIELGEIENSILISDSISDVVVVDKKDNTGDTTLVAYFCADKEIDINVLKKKLAGILPAYAVPSFFMQLPDLPLSSNGKVNRKLLPEPVYSKPVKELKKPGSKKEELVWRLCKEALGVQELSIDDDLFEYGMNSLKIMEIILGIQKETGIRLPVNGLFSRRTISEVACLMDDSLKGDSIQIPAAIRKDLYEASAAQKRLYFLCRLDPESLAYNIPIVLSLPSDVDLSRLTESVVHLVDTHESFRTSFVERDGLVYQQIADSIVTDVKLIDIKSSDELQATVGLLRKPFDLSKSPLIRPYIISSQDSRSYLFLDIHHLISDGLSIEIMANHLFSLYQGRELIRPKLRYVDFAEWQNSTDYRKLLQRSESFWLNLYQTLPEPIEIPIDFPRPAVKKSLGSSISRQIDYDAQGLIKQFIGEKKTTAFSFYMTAFAVLLYKLTNQEDFVIGTPVSGRSIPGLREIVGLFVNTLPIRTMVEPTMTLGELLDKMSSNVALALDHQDYPFEELIGKIKTERDLSRNPLFDVVFVLQSENYSADLLGNSSEQIEIERDSSKFDILLEIIEKGSSTTLVWEYSVTLFKRETLESFHNCFMNIMNQLAMNPSKTVSMVSLVSEHELQQTFANNKKAVTRSRNELIHNIFEERVKAFSERIAVQDWYSQISYQDFNRMANGFAEELNKCGAERGTIIPIMMKRSTEMLIAIYGILKAGCAYLPLDPGYPKERKQFILKDCNAKYLIVDSSYTSDDAFDGTILMPKRELGPESWIPPCTVDPSDLAYVIYTSGSTGKPKGVMVEHRGLVNIIREMQKHFPLEPKDTYLFKTTYTFDVSIAEIFGWFLEGGSLCILEPGKERDPLAIYNIMMKHSITHVNFVPSMLRAFIKAITKSMFDALRTLKWLFSCGEALSAELAKEVHEKIGSTTLVNVYGPTEATIYSTYYTVDRQLQYNGTVSIGKPFENIQTFVYSQNNQVLPVGVPGELCISGDCLARGYLNLPEITSSKFVENPLLPGVKMYRTGDLVRLTAVGDLEYLGRLDSQVKLRGFRIELGEIESRLAAYENVKDCAVVVDGCGDSMCLVAYYVSADEVASSKLREYLREYLPEYMIPSFYVCISHIPHSTSGKIDRKALPALNKRMGKSNKFADAVTMTEMRIQRIWGELLETDGISTNENFFDAGGHSLLAMQLVSRIRQELGVEVSIDAIFKNSTIYELAAFVDKMTGGEITSQPISRVSRELPMLLSFAQERMWIIDKLQESSNLYNMTLSLRISGELNSSALEKAFAMLLERHESLRTNIRIVNDLPQIFLRPASDWDIIHKDLSSNGQESAQAKLAALEEEEISHVFDLANDRLFRAVLICLNKNEHSLILNMHHIISDGWSLYLIIREMKELYQSISEGRNHYLSPLSVQYVDYAAWQKEVLAGPAIERELDYWRQKLSGIQTTALPVDMEPPKRQTFSGANLHFTMPRDIKGKLEALSREHGTTMFMTLLAAFQVLLKRYTGQQDLCIGTTVANRMTVEAEGIVGFFVNLLPIRCQLEDSMSFRDILQTVKEVTLEAYSHQDVPFERIVDAVQHRRDTSRSPIFQVMFVLQNVPREDISLPGLEFNAKTLRSENSKFELVFELEENENSINGRVEYNSDLFYRNTIERLVDGYQKIIQFVINNPQV